MAAKTTKRSLFLRILFGVVFILITLLSVMFSTAAFFIAARYTRRLGFITAAAVIVQLLSAAGAAWLLAPVFAVAERAQFAGIASASVFIVVAIAANRWVFRPLAVAEYLPQPRPDTRYWSLSTGSRIAYTGFPAEGTPQAAPILYLHGGPGIPTRASNYEFFRQLTQQGYDVYLYDQVGSGLSEHLSDISEYTVQRNVADLEAIRQQIGAEQMVLISTSWGGVLAAHYMAAYPKQVAKAIFISPGVLGDRSQVRYDYKRTASTADDSILLPPLRFIFAGALARIQPAAAQQYASQMEMSRVYDTFTTGPSVEYQVNCKGYQPDLSQPARSGGSNYYVNLLTLASLKNTPDPRPKLTSNLTPALVIRGECDYIPWEATCRYKDTLPNAEMVVVPGAGHAVTGSQPELTLALIHAFLAGQPLPLTPVASNDNPL